MFYIEKLNQVQVLKFNKKTEEKLEKFCDKFLSIRSKKFILDIFLFENFCKEKYGYNEEENGSLNDFCVKQFGQEITNFIKLLF
jgi:hypothetical protein